MIEYYNFMIEYYNFLIEYYNFMIEYYNFTCVDAGITRRGQPRRKRGSGSTFFDLKKLKIYPKKYINLEDPWILLIVTIPEKKICTN